MASATHAGFCSNLHLVHADNQGARVSKPTPCDTYTNSVSLLAG